MASSNKSPGRDNLLHVGYMVPLNELMFDNEVLQRELGHVNVRCNVYSAALFHRDTNQDSLNSWFEQRKRSSRNGYLRAFFTNKRSDTIIEMDVDGKQFYLIASSATSIPPIHLKQQVAKGLFGPRKPFDERIQVPCFPYKCDTSGFVECDAFHTFKTEQMQKKAAMQWIKMEETSVS